MDIVDKLRILTLVTIVSSKW